jgi:hypothetical protein
MLASNAKCKTSVEEPAPGSWVALAWNRWTQLLGGRQALHEFWHIDRLLGEMLGIGIAAVSMGAGYLLQQASKSGEETE